MLKLQMPIVKGQLLTKIQLMSIPSDPTDEKERCRLEINIGEIVAKDGKKDVIKCKNFGQNVGENQPKLLDLDAIFIMFFKIKIIFSLVYCLNYRYQ